MEIHTHLHKLQEHHTLELIYLHAFPHFLFLILPCLSDANPDKYYPEWYGCILAVWIFFGMAWLALVINHTIDLLGHLNAYLKSGKKGDKTNKAEDQELPETQQKALEEEKTDEICE